MPTFGSLFAGIGGIDLGLERAGWTGRWQVEWDAYCQRVLAKHWPDVPRYGDITTVDWSQVEPVDLIAGGFPCQPFSTAGKRLGIADDRWLWPEFARAIGALRPRYVLVENVPGLLAGHGGMGHVLGDLAALGYDAEWDSIPASAVGAPHLRYRVWIVGTQQSGPLADASGIGSLDDVPAGRDESRLRGSGLADAETLGRQWTGRAWAGRAGSANGGSPLAHTDVARSQGHWQLDYLGSGASQRLARARRDAVEGQWLTEPDVGRVAHGVPNRVDRLRALGNAVVPQVVEFIGRRVLEAGQE